MIRLLGTRLIGPRLSAILPLAAILSLGALALSRPATADPADFHNMILLANEDISAGYNDVWGFVGSDGREYVIQGTSSGTLWWDVDDPLNPSLVASLSEPTSAWRDMFVIGDYCFIIAENPDMGVRVVDISDPTDPTHVASYTETIGQAHNIFGDPDRNLIFVVGGSSNENNGGVQILDASDPLNLVEIAQWIQNYVHDISIEGNLAFLCLLYVDQLLILDLTVPSSPVNLGTFNSPVGNIHACWPVGDGKHVMITHETQGGHLRVVNYTDPMNPILAGIWNPAPNASAHNVHVEGSLAFVSWYNRGTRVIDVSDPENLSEVGYWDTSTGDGLSDGNWGVYPHFPSGLVAANDRQNGLFLLKYDANAGVLDGVVSSSAGSFLFPPTVEYVNLATEQEADSTGAYRFAAFPGPAHTLRFSAFGYEPDSATVALSPGGVTTTDVTLTKLPSGGLSGTVAEEGNPLPLEGAEATVRGTQLAAASDASGAWRMLDVPAGNYVIDIRYPGHASEARPVVVSDGEITNVGVALTPAAIYVDFSAPVGWTEVNDSTVVGTWRFGDPYATYVDGELFQMEDDHTLDPETDCAVTGAFTDGADDGDVDNGATRLLSPVYDLSAMTAPHLLYWRWFATENRQDAWEVEIGSAFAPNWVLLESSTLDDRRWKAVDIDLTGIFESMGAVQFRFIAQDHLPEQLLDAALDDFTIYDAGGPATGSPGGIAPPTYSFSLGVPAPNPFADETVIRFVMPRTGRAKLVIHDVRGARVITLVDRALAAGPHQVYWSGRADDGSQVAPGVYFVELRADGERRSGKILRASTRR